MIKIKTCLIIISAIILSGCFNILGGDAEKDIKLVGQRIDVMVGKANIKKTQGATQQNFLMPKPFKNQNWSQTAGNSAHALEHVALAETVHKVWETSIGQGSSDALHVLNPPVINAGRLFVINTQSEVLALSAQSGKVLWKKTLDIIEKDQASFPGGLAVEGDFLFVTTGSGEVFALTASEGKPVWNTNLEAPIRSAPSISQGRLFVITHNNRLFVLNAVTGKLLWTHSGIDEGLALLGGATPSVAHGLVAVPYSSGEVYVLRVTDGRYLWHDTLAMSVGADPFSSLVDVEASPVMANGMMYAVNFNGRLAAFSLKTGQRVWSVPLSTSQTPWVAGSVVYVLTDTGELVCMNRVDGSVRWISPLNKYINASNEDRFWSGPVLAGNRLIMASSDGYALSLDPKTGQKKQAQALLGDAGVSVAPIVANGMLYFLTNSGDVVSFR